MQDKMTMVANRTFENVTKFEYLEKIITDQICRNDIKNTLNSVVSYQPLHKFYLPVSLLRT